MKSVTIERLTFTRDELADKLAQALEIEGYDGASVLGRFDKDGGTFGEKLKEIEVSFYYEAGPGEYVEEKQADEAL